jgi:AAA+ superfamily predicted ATPase
MSRTQVSDERSFLSDGEDKETDTDDWGEEVENAVKEPAVNKMWAQSGVDFIPCQKAVDNLPPGQYVVRYSDSKGIHFSKKEINLDDLISLPDSASETVLDNIREFWGREKYFREFGFLWKRGILLWGPQGSGKTSTVQQLAKQVIDLGGISVYCTHPHNDSLGLDLLRNIEPTRPAIVILEDIDAIVEQHGEHELLALLDGELQIDNVVFVATTNYPERLDKRIVNRPSRFDELIKIGMPSDAARAVYLQAKNPRLGMPKHEGELSQWVEASNGFSIAHLKEFIISVECFGRTIDETAKRLRSMMDIKRSSDHDREGNFGFVDRD